MSDEKQANDNSLRATAEAKLTEMMRQEISLPWRGRREPSAEQVAHELQVHQIELEMQNETLRKAQTELEASRDRFVDLYDFAPVGYLTLDANGLIEELNLTAATLLGRERVKLLKRGFSSLVAPEDRDRWTRHCMALGHNGGPGRVELRLLGQENHYFQALLECVMSRELGLRVTLSDITDRQQAATALRESEERLRLALNAANQAWFDVDLASGKVAVSPEYPTMIGYDPAAFESSLSNWLAHVHPEERTAVAAAFQACIATGGTASMEYRRQTSTGDWKWLRSVGKVVQWDAQHHATRMIGIHTDINEHKLTELALQESEATFRKILEASNDAVLLQDSTAAFVDCNQTALDLLKMTREQFIKMRPEQISVEFQPNGRRSAEYAPEMTALGQKGFHRFEWTCRNLEGGEFVVEVSLTPITIRGQAMLHCTWRDITERKKMEEQVRLLAFYDPLTGLPNRRLLDDRLNQTMAASKRSGRFAALLFLDLDNFKPLNDVHGHDVGNLLLVEVANRLKSAIREIDTVARFGGDEFVVIANELTTDKLESIAQARALAEKTRIALSAPYRLTIHRDGEADRLIEHRCTATLGVAVFFDHEASPGEVLKWADAAMYQAKTAGRNQMGLHGE